MNSEEKPTGNSLMDKFNKFKNDFKRKVINDNENSGSDSDKDKDLKNEKKSSFEEE